MTKQPNADLETKEQDFESVLSAEPFKGLKAILTELSSDRMALCQALNTVDSYEAFLAKLGYKINLTQPIHVQDSYSRVGPVGGIKAVLPYYDIPTQSSLPTLVNFNSTVTTTPKAAAFFNQMLAAFKAKLLAKP